VKKILLIVFVVLLAFLYINRQRIYLRDPLANLTRNGVAEPGAQIFINFSNDVLIENDNPPRYQTLIEHGQPVGAPLKITCLHWLACMTVAVHPPLLNTVAPADTMTNKLVTFRDVDGRTASITLR
jgi:hypothetical protein